MSPTPFTAGLEASRRVESLGRWMTSAADSGAPVSEAQIRAWADACRTNAARVRELELAEADRRHGPLAVPNRIDAAFAAWVVDEATKAVTRLAALAAEAATRAELKAIDDDACGLLSALEALASGVVRRPGEPRNEQDQQGA